MVWVLDLGYSAKGVDFGGPGRHKSLGFWVKGRISDLGFVDGSC